MKVKAGYKHTEVGVIPDDWDVRRLDKSTEPQRPISYGIVQTGPNLPNGVPCLRVVDIHDGLINKTDLIRTSERISNAYRRTILKPGDLVMPLRGKVGDVGIVDEELEGANLTRGVVLLAIRKMIEGPYCRQFISWSATRTPREYLERESHDVWRTRYLLSIVESDETASVELSHKRLVLRTRAGTDPKRREVLLDNWYRDSLKRAVPLLVTKWEKLMGIKVQRVFVQRMKTKWGSCNHRAGTIRLNTELAKKPRECLEYIIVHEMAHLLEPTHNARFLALMDRFMPRWQSHRELLNGFPLRHENWSY